MAESISAPIHIGFIVDGNRRWAKKYGLPTYEGHLAGYNALKEVAKASFDSGVEFVSAYVFSTENWKRDAKEVRKLMGLVGRLITSDLNIFHEEKIRLKVLGTREGLSEKIIQDIDEAESQTKDYKGKTLALCFNYGGKLEVSNAVGKIISAGFSAEEITPELIDQYIYSPDIPDCDLIVRTSGEKRLSNFMLWRSAYSEFIFLDQNWPDMKPDTVKEIIEEFNSRNRRFGGN